MIRRDFISSVVGAFMTGQTSIFPSIFSFFVKPKPKAINIVESFNIDLENNKYRKFIVHKNGEIFAECGFNLIPLKTNYEKAYIGPEYTHAISLKYKNLHNTIYFKDKDNYNVALMWFEYDIGTNIKAYRMIKDWGATL